MSEDLHDSDLLNYGGLEFPHIHYERCNAKPYRYVYGCGFGHLVADSLLKIDLENKNLKVSLYPWTCTVYTLCDLKYVDTWISHCNFFDELPIPKS